MTRLSAALALVALPAVAFAETAPGSPGAPGTWAYAGKTGIGTSYAPYGATRAASRVWFSLAKGVLTETMYGLIHQAQLRELQFAVKGDGFVAFEDGDGITTRQDYLTTDAEGRPQSLAYRVVNTDKAGRFQIEKHVFTDPDSDTLFLRVIVRAKGGALTPLLLADPQMKSTSGGDRAEGSPAELHAWEGDTHLVIKGAEPFRAASVGFVGASDGETELKRTGTIGAFDTTGPQTGNVAVAAELAPVPPGGERVYDIVLGFGPNHAAADASADATLKRGYQAVRQAYDGGHGHPGWADYLASLSELPRVAAMSGDGGRLAYASAMVLKAQEDKTHPGALIASLSTPWGNTVSADAAVATGYKAVWPRDFYQVASALMALGDRQTPVAALNYLHTVQVLPSTPGNHGATGWFLQKTQVDGTPEWVGVQLDQTAMPIMLGDKLWRAGFVTKAELQPLWTASLKPAADFLVTGGRVDFMSDHGLITPPKTQMERWEEQGGYSPSTTAAEIAGLYAAADLAQGFGDGAAAARYAERGRAMSDGVEASAFTTAGVYGDRRYFERISPDGHPDSGTPIAPRNGKPGLPQQDYLDAGFLELVRYGVRSPSAGSILTSLPKVDDESLPNAMRIRYDFRFPGQSGVYPGWRRYSDDGYGEDDVTGAGFGPVGPTGKDSPNQRGRVWPIFTGERGHYEIAAAAAKPGGASAGDMSRIGATYAHGMELFANGGLMIPEQVYDGVGASGGTEAPGQGTGSATPLAWSHAEYVKLLRSLADRRVWDELAPQALAAGAATPAR